MSWVIIFICDFVLFQTIALHSELLKKTRVDSSDVNAVLRLMDTSPIVGSHASTYLSFGEEKLCCQNVSKHLY